MPALYSMLLKCMDYADTSKAAAQCNNQYRVCLVFLSQYGTSWQKQKLEICRMLSQVGWLLCFLSTPWGYDYRGSFGERVKDWNLRSQSAKLDFEAQVFLASESAYKHPKHLLADYGRLTFHKTFFSHRRDLSRLFATRHHFRDTFLSGQFTVEINSPQFDISSVNSQSLWRSKINECATECAKVPLLLCQSAK